MTEHAYLAAIRESYDTIAVDYAQQVTKPAELDPVSRALLAAFAEVVAEAGRGPVVDVGCGPGHVTAHLAALGVPVSGVDLSPKMVEQARRAYPHLDFAVGTNTALDAADATLGGVLAYYSTHHTPPDHLPAVFREFHRVLAPGGWLMVAGYVGDGGQRRPTRAYGGHEVSYVSFRHPPSRVADLIGDAGLTVTARLEEGAEPGARRWTATFLARRPEAPPGAGQRASAPHAGR
ncbi:methyltransferase domain-containing protein [Streptomyces sp. G45]|uniref:class I SAM-dependent methyltransferase n=1 Tax=Streptomyces sp. G45 TaxID=3406627 RepID=UPI003C2AA5D9